MIQIIQTKNAGASRKVSLRYTCRDLFRRPDPSDGRCGQYAEELSDPVELAAITTTTATATTSSPETIDWVESALFSPLRIGHLQLRNPIVMAPMTREFSPDG